MQCCLQPRYGGGFCQKEFVPNGMRCAPGKCTLDKTVWNLVYRNYYDDAHFGIVKCATFRDLRNFKDYFTSIRSDKNGTFNSSEKIVLKSSPGYTAKNLIQLKSEGKNGTVEVNVIYTDCQKCIVLRHPYANDGYGCTYWRRYDTIKEQTDGCEFIYDELCGTVPKYRTYTSTCTPKTFVIVPDLPSKPWDWSLLSKLFKFLKDLLPTLKLPSLANPGKPPKGLTISL
uniref:Lipocalin n=1 Tax=Rhipicephalus zambeziensis TaxID=60191 RepID=A0A224YLR0_9ACAR